MMGRAVQGALGPALNQLLSTDREADIMRPEGVPLPEAVQTALQEPGSGSVLTDPLLSRAQPAIQTPLPLGCGDGAVLVSRPNRLGLGHPAS